MQARIGGNYGGVVKMYGRTVNRCDHCAGFAGDDDAGGGIPRFEADFVVAVHRATRDAA